MKKLFFLSSLLAVGCISAYLTKVFEPCACISSKMGAQFVVRDQGGLKTVPSCGEININPFLKNQTPGSAGLDQWNRFLEEWKFLFQESGLSEVQVFLSDEISSLEFEAGIWSFPSQSNDVFDERMVLENVFLVKGEPVTLAKWKSNALVSLRRKAKGPSQSSDFLDIYWGSIFSEISRQASPLVTLRLMSEVLSLRDVPEIEGQKWAIRGETSEFEKDVSTFLAVVLRLDGSLLAKLPLKLSSLPPLVVSGEKELGLWLTNKKKISSKVQSIVYSSCSLPSLTEVAQFSGVKNFFFVKACDGEESPAIGRVADLYSQDIEFIHFHPRAVSIGLRINKYMASTYANWKKIFIVKKISWDTQKKIHEVSSAFDGISSYRILESRFF